MPLKVGHNIEYQKCHSILRLYHIYHWWRKIKEPFDLVKIYIHSFICYINNLTYIFTHCQFGTLHNCKQLSSAPCPPLAYAKKKHLHPHTHARTHTHAQTQAHRLTHMFTHTHTERDIKRANICHIFVIKVNNPFNQTQTQDIAHTHTLANTLPYVCVCLSNWIDCNSGTWAAAVLLFCCCPKRASLAIALHFRFYSRAHSAAPPGGQRLSKHWCTVGGKGFSLLLSLGMSVRPSDCLFVCLSVCPAACLSSWMI